MRVNDLAGRLVVDASCGLKWVVEEAHADAAFAVMPGRRLVTIDLFWPEAANALVKKARRGELTSERAADAFRDLTTAPLITRSRAVEAVSAAFVLAQELDHSVYDCCYLALALEEDAVVVTADRRFQVASLKQPMSAGRVVHLSDLVLDAGPLEG